MERALQLAARGQGSVEPNPMVGCVLVVGGKVVGEGWHRLFGGPHAEVEALRAAGDAAAGATAYVTLEPCCHQGKTPPCTRSLIAAGIRRVVVAQRDPFPHVQGKGLAELRQHGIDVVSGLLEEEAARINAPYLKLQRVGQPWVLAKWAMTLDGKLASRTGRSQWISGEASRKVVHELRGRVDGILVGRGTVLQDDPRLTARPPGPRIATRIVLTTTGDLPETSQLVQTAGDVPVLVAMHEVHAPHAEKTLNRWGIEAIALPNSSPRDQLTALLNELGRRGMTNILVEGGSRVFGTFLDGQFIDEVHAFIGTQLLGGQDAYVPIAGTGYAGPDRCPRLESPRIVQLDNDAYITGRVSYTPAPSDDSSQNLDPADPQ